MPTITIYLLGEADIVYVEMYKFFPLCSLIKIIFVKA